MIFSCFPDKFSIIFWKFLDDFSVRIDFTPRCPVLGCKVVFVQGTEWTLRPNVLDWGMKSIFTDFSSRHQPTVSYWWENQQKKCEKAKRKMSKKSPNFPPTHHLKTNQRTDGTFIQCSRLLLIIWHTFEDPLATPRESQGSAKPSLRNSIIRLSLLTGDEWGWRKSQIEQYVIQNSLYYRPIAITPIKQFKLN